MKLGSRGEKLIKSREKLRLQAYAATEDERRRGIWTIGWGHTAGVREGDTCTKEQADAWFRADIAVRERKLNSLDLPLTQGMFDALMSLCYNGNIDEVLAGTTIGKPLREKNWWAAWRGFIWWTKQSGQPLRGLAIRRAEEMMLFMADPLP